MEPKFILTVHDMGQVYSTSMYNLSALATFLSGNVGASGYKEVLQVEVSRVNGRTYVHIYVGTKEENQGT